MDSVQLKGSLRDEMRDGDYAARRRGWRMCLTRNALFAFLAVPCFSGARADVVVLRSGVRYADVRTKPSAESHRIEFSDGRFLVVPNLQIASVRPGPTTWLDVVTLGLMKPNPIQLPEFPAREAVATAESSRWRKADWGPILKSTILPGWGQFSEGRRVTGSLYAVGAVFLVNEYWTIRQKHAQAEADYNDPTFTGAVASQTLTGTLTIGQAAMVNIAYLSRKEREVYRLEKRGNYSLLVLGVLWSWNMLDIVTGGVPWEWNRTGSSNRPVETAVMVSPIRGGLMIVLRVSL